MMNIDQNRRRVLLGILLGICLYSQLLLAEVLYVDQRADKNHNGSSWDQAFTNFQVALMVAEYGDQIHMAQGIYTPTQPGGDPNATFLLVSGVAVKGGYAGLGADDPNVRDVNAFATVLSGDLNGDDGDKWSFREDNVFHVVTAVGTDANTVVDGLIIADGHAFEGDRAYIPWLDPNSRGGGGTEKSKGGGLIIRNARPDQVSSVTLQNCVFRDNTSIGGGAAVCNLINNSVTAHQCDFVNNYTAFSAGAIDSTGKNSEVLLTRCNFYGNGSKSHGSVIEILMGRLTAEHCRFLNNAHSGLSATVGTLYFSSADVLLDNCLFSGNRFETVITSTFSSTLTLLNCTIVGNTMVAPPGPWGYVIDTWGSDLKISNSIIWGNPRERDPSINPVHYDYYPHYQLRRRGDDGTFLVDHSFVESWLDNEVPGAQYPDPNKKDPMFVDADGPDDVFGTPDDDFRLLPGSPCIDTGLNQTDPNLADTDFGGLPRIINKTVDIGAHEFEGIIYVVDPEPSRGWWNPYLGTEAFPFKHIQSAVDVALTGQTVLVAPGVYSPANHTLTLTGKNIILQSTDPSDPVTANQTIISGTVVFEGSEDPNCVLAGFRIQHNQYGAIYGNTTRATLKHCYIIDNGPCDGSVLVECDGLIQNCLIADNMADGDCGLYPVIYRCSASFVNCTIANNDSGIHVNNASFENCILYHNVDPYIYVEGRGGAEGSLTLYDCCVEGASPVSRTGDSEVPNIVAAEGAIVNLSHIWQDDPLFVRLGTKSGGGHGETSSHGSLGDYHLKTPAWRWSDVAVHGSHWVYDMIDYPSPCIDAAHPDKSYGEELQTIPEDPDGLYGVNNGLNYGVYGGTWQASFAPRW